MKSIVNGIIILVALIVFGCTKENIEPRTADLSIPVLTGFVLRDAMGGTIGMVGNPNIKTNCGDIRTLAYPNPVGLNAYVYINGLDPYDTVTVWVVPAQYVEEENTCENSNNLIVPVLGGCPVVSAVVEADSTGVARTGVDFENIPDGYYRVYTKIGYDLLYDNLIVDKDFYSVFH